MGGHGGLNILPQKRWNVYNFDNRERVRKDEEEAAQKQQEAERLARQRDSEFRLETLREIALTKRLAGEEGAELGQGAATSVNVVKVEHINLFKEVVERPVVGSSTHGERKGRDEGRRKEGKQDPTEASEEQYRFAYGALGKSSKRPWYVTKSFVVGREGEDTGDEDAICRQPSGLEKKKKRKNVEELRAERVQREELEGMKARKLMAAKAAAAAGFQRGGVSGRYNQSYGNAR